jgi:hypothetical protein
MISKKVKLTIERESHSCKRKNSRGLLSDKHQMRKSSATYGRGGYLEAKYQYLGSDGRVMEGHSASGTRGALPSVYERTSQLHGWGSLSPWSFVYATLHSSLSKEPMFGGRSTEPWQAWFRIRWSLGGGMSRWPFFKGVRGGAHERRESPVGER